MSVSTILLASSWPLANEHQAQAYQSLALLSPSLFILIIMEEEKKIHREGCSTLLIFLILSDPGDGGSKGRVPKRLRDFGHMSKLGLPYLPITLVWTKIRLDKYSSVHPSPYIPLQKVWTFWI